MKGFRSSCFLESDAEAQADDIACLAEEFGPFGRGYIEAVIRHLKCAMDNLEGEDDSDA